MKIPFEKYQGTGNDFILIDNRNLFFLTDKELIMKLCDRRFGIGADGLLLLQYENAFDFRMVYYNSDGSEATFCGNGARCIVAFAHFLGIITRNCRFIAADGVHTAEVLSSDEQSLNISLQMNEPVIYPHTEDGYYLNTGTYHLVKFVDDPAKVDVEKVGRQIRYNAAYQPHGTNVNFVKAHDNNLYIRTYEKGVEAETLSCGTGVTASAIAASLRENKFNRYTVHTLGGALEVRFSRIKDKFSDIYLIGPATHVYSGNIDTAEL